VFFTKGKSLIFYAYDLDRHDGQRRESTFQAWGRRGRNFGQALPLGIMYLDSSAKRRWVLRLDDPSTLAKIDAVFVTVEPSGGSEKPTGNPLLFAYLKIEPNHP
jgi:anti-sigma-K factor RskA